MCILLNKEITIIGLFCTIMAIEGKVKDISIKPFMAMEYAKFLNHTDCGLIIKQFNEIDIVNLLNLHYDLFIKDRNKEGYYKLNIDHENINTTTKLSTYLISKLLPKLNYSRKFLESMYICDKK